MAVALDRLRETEIDSLYLDLWQTLCAVGKGIEFGGGGTFLIFELAGRIVGAKRSMGSGPQICEFRHAPETKHILSWLAGIATDEAPLKHLIQIVPVRADDGSVAWHNIDGQGTQNSAQIATRLDMTLRSRDGKKVVIQPERDPRRRPR